MKKILSILTIFLLSIVLFSCGNASNSEDTKSDISSKPSESVATKPSVGISIVVYFSATSHTKNVAEEIAKYTNSTIYELEPVNPYTSADLNYNNQNSRVCKEHNDPNRHVELATTSFPLFSEAKYVYLGAPVWWQEMSFVIDDFVKNNDFAGKTIIPFATSASSSFSVTKLEKLTNNATWLSPKRFSSNASIDSIHSWIDSLSL